MTQEDSFQKMRKSLDKYKKEFMNDSTLKTLADVMNGADAFLGLSVPKTVTKDMVKSMAKNPIIFAMANPTPEIFPDEVHEVRDDAIMAMEEVTFQIKLTTCLVFLLSSGERWM